MYYTYMIRCEDGSLYTGMTNDLVSRFKKHLGKKGAKYTKSHTPKNIEIAWKSKDKSLACKLECHLKGLTRIQKEDVIKSQKISTYLSGKVDCRRYSVISIDKYNLTNTNNNDNIVS